MRRDACVRWNIPLTRGSSRGLRRHDGVRRPRGARASMLGILRWRGMRARTTLTPCWRRMMRAIMCGSIGARLTTASHERIGPVALGLFLSMQRRNASNGYLTSRACVWPSRGSRWPARPCAVCQRSMRGAYRFCGADAVWAASPFWTIRYDARNDVRKRRRASRRAAPVNAALPRSCSVSFRSSLRAAC